MAKTRSESPHSVPSVKPAESGKNREYREKAKTDSKASLKAAQNNNDWMIDVNKPEKGKFDRIQSITPEKLSDGRKAISSALKNMSTPAYKNLFKKLGITLESTDYYLAIAIKESGLNQQGVSVSNAKGLFQLKTGSGQALDDVNRIFSLNLQDKDVFSTVPKYQEQVAKNNATAGILYWHICKDVFPKNKKLEISKEDKDRTAAFIYKLGAGDFANLWQSIGAKNFNDFAINLSSQLAQKFPENFVLPKGGRDVFQDDTYKLNFASYIYTSKPLIGGIITIGARNYDAANLVQTLRYSEVIQSLSRKQPEAYELTNDHYKLWSIADKLLTRCGYAHKIEYCQKNSVSNSKKIWLFVEIIKAYNIKLNNPDFADFTDDDEPEELENGAKVFLPSKEYLEKAIKKSHEDVKEESVPIKPGLVPMYSGANAAKMEKIGNQFIAAPKENPQIVIPRYKQRSGEYLDPYVETDHGRMPKSKTKALVIHSTEGGADILREGQNIHFVLRRDGVAELIHDMDIAVSHAGNMTSKSQSKRAIWEGERQPSYHTVGIEVINMSLPTLIREGKVNVPLDKKAKVELVKIVSKNKKGKVTTRMALITATPPTQKAIDIGFQLAHQERGFTDAQYKTLKNLVAYIGSQKGLRYKDVVTHSMIAASDSGRGRKSDPPVLDWGRLGLPNNYYRVDPDVATGTIKSNLAESESIRTGKKMTMLKYNGKLYYEVLDSKIDGKPAYSYFPEARFGGSEDMTVGVKAAEKIYQDRKKKKQNKK
ncbi:MAG: N-acetylmuramoyl-L-alanine amidase [Candidatus Peregrinibacteria bacterium]|nr:N-acetylmuramoyl-L-alanine amidase [Candidatus Peregrinibacteria bacterium]